MSEARDLLKAARDCVKRDAMQWPNDGGPEILARIDAFLSRPEAEPVAWLYPYRNGTLDVDRNVPRYPESFPVWRQLPTQQKEKIVAWVVEKGRIESYVPLPRGTKLYAKDSQ